MIEIAFTYVKNANGTCDVHKYETNEYGETNRTTVFRGISEERAQLLVETSQELSDVLNQIRNA
jgi:hypothetical protein